MRKPCLAQRPRRLPDREKFGVRRRVVVAHDPVVGARQDLSARRINQDRADRHFPGLGGEARFGDRAFHMIVSRLHDGGETAPKAG